ncbi:hypothetical protein PU629_13100 [Pullulanibacillus sp. KACC 23026]|uniref:TolB family protein n=1 Tax=Pullulanibacillus sp. KACC 23026 TaxID=3028315 RepID=UPI0023AF58C4|nr:hypothetical protein [Pullulanibacillus sp. KACC 23026]WEG11108.1 hypothetical protein PU629_13100 [Pullulanibacillus sp. KACC 23026]
MTKGREFASELLTFTDPISGVTIKQLTNGNAHNFHLYFTNSGWYDRSKLIFGSDRNNCTNLYSMDLDTGKFVQLTDLDREGSHGIQGTVLAFHSRWIMVC